MMKNKLHLALAAIAWVAVAAGAAGSLFVAEAAGPRGNGPELARVKAAVAPLHTTKAAENAQYGLISGLDSCFEMPGAGGMGFHYINAGLLDETLDPTQPEALVYQQLPNGKLRLGAVEYIVPQALWDDDHPLDSQGQRELPSIDGLANEPMSLHLNAGLQVYVLHAWIFTANPAGTFEDWNPDVSCLPGTGHMHPM
jgi:hypothetical protein